MNKINKYVKKRYKSDRFFPLNFYMKYIIILVLIFVKKKKQ